MDLNEKSAARGQEDAQIDPAYQLSWWKDKKRKPPIIEKPEVKKISEFKTFEAYLIERGG